MFAVFVVRGALPFAIVWISNPSLGPIGTLTAAFSNDPKIIQAIEQSSPLLLMGGGVFLVFLFLNWLFLEPKNFGLRGEGFFKNREHGFCCCFHSSYCDRLVCSSTRPYACFRSSHRLHDIFIVHGFRNFAEEQEKKLLGSGMSDISKIAYLEALDSTFSIDGVIGAFAFTFSVPLILLGNGLGALVLRKLTVSNIDKIKNIDILKMEPCIQFCF